MQLIILSGIDTDNKAYLQISGVIHIKVFFTLHKNICYGYSFVCVEVLRPSQPNAVMSSAISLPNYTFTGQA